MESSTRGVLVVLVVLIVIALSGPFLMGGMMGPGGMSGMGGWHLGFMWGLGGLTTLAFLGLVLAGIVWLIRLVEGSGKSRGLQGEGPLDIVRRRYASGELTKEQFEQMRDDLEPR